MKQLTVLLLPPEWDASPLQGYPQLVCHWYPLYSWVERDNVGQSFLSKETTQWQGLGLEPPTFRSEVQHAIVTRGTGYETLQVSKAKTKVLQFMLKVLRPCTIFCFTFAHYG